MIPENGTVTGHFNPQFYSTVLPTDSIVGAHSSESSDNRSDTQRSGHSSGTYQEISRNDSLTNLKYFECYLCKCMKIRKYDLITHIRVTHTGEKPFKCDQEGCNKSFPSKSYLKQHSYCHSAKKFKCHRSDCNKLFKTKVALNQHVKTHGEKPFKCDREWCDKSFSSKSCLKQHNYCHSAKKFKCHRSDCNKLFKTKAALNQHVETHGEKKFECDHEGCDKLFTTKHYLKIHKKRHSNKRLFKCDQMDCNKTFKDRSSLHHHKVCHLISRLHQTENNNNYLVTQCKNDVVDAKFNHLCDRCSNTFVQQEQFIFHLRDVHNIDIVHCNICDLPLENEDSRTEHVKNHFHQN